MEAGQVFGGRVPRQVVPEYQGPGRRLTAAGLVRGSQLAVARTIEQVVCTPIKDDPDSGASTQPH
ncbi:hypothetical protein CALVIDRAFT_542836 [Calocera viscosa TUFC12733]|uniref:Uncharacterized protein n=1 Tax=Calocera viscosa (strain TUFC12733) TaxID=1330018 RepID=A0A167G880_CALVF|nr:hypothetical protein CALVIDRAFT_542836 [Calocera viscosa TUFC12733]